MVRKLVLVALVTVIAIWVGASVAATNKPAPSPTPATAAPTHSCSGALDVTQPIPAGPEFCWVSFCSVAEGIRCVLDSGVRCDQGNCHYQRVDDPSCVVPEAGPSCAVGCH